VTATSSVYVDAPVEAVFDFFRDPGNWQDAQRGITFCEVHLTEEGTGSFYTWRARVAGVTVEGFDVFTEFVPNQHITDRSSLAFEGTWTYSFTAEGSGTRVTLQNQARGLWRLPVLERVVDALAVAGHRPVLTALRAKLEATPRPTATG
jgi:hypothetical protein